MSRRVLRARRSSAAVVDQGPDPAASTRRRRLGAGTAWLGAVGVAAALTAAAGAGAKVEALVGPPSSPVGRVTSTTANGWRVATVSGYYQGSDSRTAPLLTVTSDGRASVVWGDDAPRDVAPASRVHIAGVQVASSGAARRLASISGSQPFEISSAPSGRTVVSGTSYAASTSNQPALIASAAGTRWRMKQLPHGLTLDGQPDPPAVNPAGTRVLTETRGKNQALHLLSVGANGHTTEVARLADAGAWGPSEQWAANGNTVWSDDGDTALTPAAGKAAAGETALAVVGPAPHLVGIAGTDRHTQEAMVAREGQFVAVGAIEDTLDDGDYARGIPEVAVGTQGALTPMTQIPGPKPRRAIHLRVAMLSSGTAIVTWLEKNSGQGWTEHGVPHWAAVDQTGAVTAQGTLTKNDDSYDLELATVGDRVFAAWDDSPGPADVTDKIHTAFLDGHTVRTVPAPPGEPYTGWVAPLQLAASPGPGGGGIALAFFGGDDGRVVVATRIAGTSAGR